MKGKKFMGSLVHWFIDHASRFTFHVSHAVYNVITRRHKGKLPTFIRGMLTPPSWIYGALVALRSWLYDLRIRCPRCLPCAVISVGNIVASGTGKTPTVIWIARYLQSEGFHVAVLLRGYRRKGSPSTAIVSNGRRILTPVTESGDEAAMIARELPGIPVVVGKDRYVAGFEAIRLLEYGQEKGFSRSLTLPDAPNRGREGKAPAVPALVHQYALILDDGFQHRGLARDLDIVTVDSTQPFGTGKLLPAGTLREPRSALKRADIVLLTRTDFATDPVTLQQFVPGEQIFESRHQPTKLYRLGTDEKLPLDLLNGQRLLAVCGIGNPEAFAETLRRYEPQCVELLAFPDHHQYMPADLSQIRTQASQACADLIVTTKKDAQKLANTKSKSEELQIFVLAIELEITKNRGAFKQRLRQVVTEFQK